MSWEYKTLDELGEVSRGKSKHRPRDDKRLFGGAYPFIQTAEVKAANFYINDYTETYSEFGLAQSKLWHPGTLCFTIAANIADSAILAIDACFPDSVMGFVPYKNVSDVRFVKYCFDILQKDCKQISQGAAQDNLSWKKLSTIKFPAPPYETQKRIADVLSAYDNLIENNQKQIKLLEEAAQRLYKEWFVDLRFPGHETTKIVDGIPTGWQEKFISELCLKMNAGGTPSRGKKSFYALEGHRWFKTKELLDNWLIDSEEHISDEGLAGSSAKLFPPNTIVMAIYASPTLGRLGIMRHESTTNQAALCMAADSSKCSWQWLFHKLYELRDEFNAIARGAGQQNISGDAVKSKVVVVPTKKLMDLFTKNVEPIFEKMYVLTDEIEKLKQTRDRLLPKLMSGEIEVR